MPLVSEEGGNGPSPWVEQGLCSLSGSSRVLSGMKVGAHPLVQQSLSVRVSGKAARVPRGQGQSSQCCLQQKGAGGNLGLHH